MTIRRELPTDIDAITEVTVAAFAGQPYSYQTEHFIVHALRSAGALSLSLVAEIDGKVVGHVAFSPLTVDHASGAWYGVGPLSVMPEHQRCGIGRALMREGLAILKESGAEGVALVGHPAYYTRLGFTTDTALTLPGVPPEVFLVYSITENKAHGEVAFHEAFTATG